MRFLFATVVTMFMVSVEAYPGGAPPAACNTMTPNHAGTVRLVPSIQPYRLDAEKVSLSSAYVMLTGGDFKGYIIRAFDDEGLVTGYYGGAGVQQLPCGATHTDSLDKNDVVLLFEADRYFVGPVQFEATIVKNYNFHAMNVLSARI